MDNINLDGGHLSLEQLNAIFRTIPQEMDVLDENDRIVWSSMNKNRLFKRTKKILVKLFLRCIPAIAKDTLKKF